MEPRNKTSSDHFYDDTVNTKCNNGLVDKSTSIEGTNAHYINQNKPIQPTASETHHDMPTGKDLSLPHVPPKPITKSFHKSFSSESANKPTAFPATKTDGDPSTGKDLSSPSLPPKLIATSIHKPMTSSNKPTASPSTKATQGDPSTSKDLSRPHLPPKPIVKSIHKPSNNKPTASSPTKNDGDPGPSTDKDLSPPSKPIVTSTHKQLLLRKRYV